MPGMPEDASQGRYLQQAADRICSLNLDYKNTLGNVQSSGANRELFGQKVMGEPWFTEQAARDHVCWHWCNMENDRNKHQGWWREPHLPHPKDADYDDTVDRVLTEAIIHTLELRYNNWDGVPRQMQDPANPGKTVPAPFDVDILWQCAGNHAKVVVWATRANVIMLLMTPPSPDKINSYTRYRRNIMGPVTARQVNQDYEDRFGKKRDPERQTIDKEKPAFVRGAAEPFLIVSDIHNSPDPDPEHPNPNNDVFPYIDLTSKQVKNVIAFRPFARSDEMTNPWVYP